MEPLDGDAWIGSGGIVSLHLADLPLGLQNSHSGLPVLSLLL